MRVEAKKFEGIPAHSCIEGSRKNFGEWHAKINMKHVALIIFLVFTLISSAIGQHKEPAFVDGQILVQLRAGYDLESISER